MSLEHVQYLVVEAGITINTGLHEDSDFYFTTANTILAVAGPLKNGAIPVQVVEDGKMCPEVLFFHQPEPVLDSQLFGEFSFSSPGKIERKST